MAYISQKKKKESGGRGVVSANVQRQESGVTRWSDLDSERWPCWRQNLGGWYPRQNKQPELDLDRS